MCNITASAGHFPWLNVKTLTRHIANGDFNIKHQLTALARLVTFSTHSEEAVSICEDARTYEHYDRFHSQVQTLHQLQDVVHAMDTHLL